MVGCRVVEVIGTVGMLVIGVADCCRTAALVILPMRCRTVAVGSVLDLHTGRICCKHLDSEREYIYRDIFDSVIGCSGLEYSRVVVTVAVGPAVEED